MRELEFHGYSDDVFSWGEDEIDAYGSLVTVCVAAVSGRMAVTAAYLDGLGTWSIGVAPMDEGEMLPSWPMRRDFRDYTAVLLLTVPDDAVVTVVSRGDIGSWVKCTD